MKHDLPNFFHSLLAQDGRIIIYGGTDPQGPPPDQLSVLDTTEQIFKWSIPVVNYTPRFMPFARHTATLVGNYMIVAFGRQIFIFLYNFFFYVSGM